MLESRGDGQVFSAFLSDDLSLSPVVTSARIRTNGL